MPPDFSELSKLFISKILKFKDERASLSLLKDDSEIIKKSIAKIKWKIILV